MNKALFLAATAIGLMAASAATHDAPAPVQPRAEPAWTEFKWPFPVDQWGIGRAFACKATACGVEVKVYLRPKIGFCKCATGVDDDDELERVGDNALIEANTAALAPSRVVEVAWMKGRSRLYRVSGAARGRVLSIAFNDQCDVMVALATLGPGDPDDRAGRARVPQQRAGAALGEMAHDVRRLAEVTLEFSISTGSMVSRIQSLQGVCSDLPSARGETEIGRLDPLRCHRFNIVATPQIRLLADCSGITVRRVPVPLIIPIDPGKRKNPVGGATGESLMWGAPCAGCATQSVQPPNPCQTKAARVLIGTDADGSIAAHNRHGWQAECGGTARVWDRESGGRAH